MKSETSFRVFFLKQHRKSSLKNIFFPSESVFLDFSFWPQGHRTWQNAHCALSPLSFRLSMISCLTDGWDGKDDGAMVNVVDKLAQKPASPLVPSRHMKLSLDDLKALQEHIKDLLGPKDLKKIAGPTNIRPTWSMFLPWNSAHHLPPDHQLHFTFASKCPLAPNYAFRVWEGAPKCIFGCCQPC